MDISVNKSLIAESQPQQLNGRPDQSTDSNPVGVMTRSQVKASTADRPELIRCEILTETVSSTSLSDPIESVCFNDTAHDASLLSVDGLGCIDSNMDTESASLSDEREIAADLSDSDEAKMPPDLPPVWWDSMMSDMKKDISSMFLNIDKS